MIYVLIIFFWEFSRGYAVTNVPGYTSLESCKAAITALENPAKYGYGHTIGVCIPGPEVTNSPEKKP